jgi:predicted GH43/DUF377 family glycosyl hydrolase
MFLRLACLAALIFWAGSPVWSQIHWHRYSSNPVFAASPSGNPNSLLIPYYALGPAVLWDPEKQLYQAWFESLPITAVKYSFSQAISFDGLLWYYCSVSPVLECDQKGFDSEALRGPCVVRNGREYHMYYSGLAGKAYAIGFARSEDGIHWKKLEENPILKPGPPGSWDHAGVLYCKVVRVYGTWFMWYSGRDGSTSRIGLATSPDGITWRKHPSNPVLDVGPAGAWDARYVEAPGVAFVNGVYYMLYTGRPEFSQQQIGLATSVDGIEWKKYPGNPVLAGAPGWEGSNVGVSSLIARGDTFHLWYSANGSGYWQAGYATSPIENPWGVYGNVVANGGFEDGMLAWRVTSRNEQYASVEKEAVRGNNALRILAATRPVTLTQEGMGLRGGTRYCLAFDARSEQRSELTARASIRRSEEPWRKAGEVHIAPSSLWRTFVLTFATPGSTEEVLEERTELGTATGDGREVFIDNVVLQPAIEETLLTVPMSVEAHAVSQPVLRQHYPQSDSVPGFFEIELSSSAHVTLEILSPLGQRVGQLIGRELPAGIYRLHLRPAALSAGIYLYRLHLHDGAHEEQLTGKAVFF